MTAGDKEAGIFETPGFFSFHHINAFEAGQAQVVVDTIALASIDFSNNYQSANLFEGDMGKGIPTRLVIDGRTGQVRLLFACAMLL